MLEIMYLLLHTVCGYGKSNCKFTELLHNKLVKLKTHCHYDDGLCFGESRQFLNGDKLILYLLYHRLIAVSTDC